MRGEAGDGNALAGRQTVLRRDLSDGAGESGSPAYSIHTIEKVRATLDAGDELFFIIGRTRSLKLNPGIAGRM